MRVVLEALLDRAGAFEVTGPVERVRANEHTGIRHLPVRLEARSRQTVVSGCAGSAART
ncbi:hypothetical protein [Nocardioides stalactiti]|uniref:hypothetical protein n=1 Tax=Nocardioides stalactiti TaxID=2755356 RepID=UPI0015FFD89C|nr:hypothetical protein [Nocardioides stalactiti]